MIKIFIAQKTEREKHMAQTAIINILKHSFVQILSLFLILTERISDATSPNIVKSIPGFPGNLPFHLETGYIGVGENEGVQLFYYFIKSEGNPEVDPLMLWLTGGPGCSALSGLVLEIGPLNFNTSACNWHSKAPTYQLNPYSWTKVASIIFLDSPVGSGFSYSKTPEDSYSDDNTSSRHIYQFLRKWLVDHAGFHNNHLYISGDSYSGKIVPIVVQEIITGNEIGLQPVMNLKGYILGNPLTREDTTKARYEHARRLSILSDELYESTRTSCNGTFDEVGADNDNVMCTRNLEVISNIMGQLFEGYVLKPKCISNQTWCQESIYRLLAYWANDIKVRAALHIREGTKSEWIRCNRSSAYTPNIESTVGYHHKLTQEPICALIYSGDQDIFVSYVGTLEWIKMLNISIVDDWRPWFVNGQVAGYTTMFSNDNYHLTYTTVRAAGHTAPEYKRPECFTMLAKWFARLPL